MFFFLLNISTFEGRRGYFSYTANPYTMQSFSIALYLFIFYISFMGWVKLPYGTVVILPI